MFYSVATLLKVTTMTGDCLLLRAPLGLKPSGVLRILTRSLQGSEQPAYPLPKPQHGLPFS